MKEHHRNRLLTGLLLVLGASAAGTAHASISYTYTYDYNFTVNAGCTGGWYGSCGLTGVQTGSSANPSPAPTDPNAPPTSLSATATGWANTQGNSSDFSTQTLEKGHVQAWTSGSQTGLGVRNLDYSSMANGGESRTDANEGSSSNGEHSVDNNERYDSLLYSFSEAISLTQVSLSWYSNDADIIVLAFTGDNFVESTHLAGLRYSQLIDNGWSLIGNYSNLQTTSNQRSISTDVSSSYWLIGAANPLVVGGTNDSKLDYVKIAALGATVTTKYTPPPPPSAVPEPGSLALLGLGLLLLARARPGHA